MLSPYVIIERSGLSVNVELHKNSRSGLCGPYLCCFALLYWTVNSFNMKIEQDRSEIRISVVKLSEGKFDESDMAVHGVI